MLLFDRLLGRGVSEGLLDSDGRAIMDPSSEMLGQELIESRNCEMRDLRDPGVTEGDLDTAAG